jgi:hypothetical protein
MTTLRTLGTSMGILVVGTLKVELEIRMTK